MFIIFNKCFHLLYFHLLTHLQIFFPRHSSQYFSGQSPFCWEDCSMHINLFLFGLVFFVCFVFPRQYLIYSNYFCVVSSYCFSFYLPLLVFYLTLDYDMILHTSTLTVSFHQCTVIYFFLRIIDILYKNTTEIQVKLHDYLKDQNLTQNSSC